MLAMSAITKARADTVERKFPPRSQVDPVFCGGNSWRARSDRP